MKNAEKIFLEIVVGFITIKQFFVDCDFRACVSEKLCYLRDVVSQSLEYARGGIQRDESARRSVHSESLRCRL